MSIDWTAPLQFVGGGSAYLRAYLKSPTELVSLTADEYPRRDARHALDQYASGVRYIITQDRNHTPQYYREDGTHWLGTQNDIRNVPGAQPGEPLDEREGKARLALLQRKKDREARRLEFEKDRDARQREYEKARAAGSTDAEKRLVEELAAAIVEAEAMEANPMWGTF